MTTVHRARAADDLCIAGLVRCSGADWPGRLAATVFLQGCPWDCTYCHNPALRDVRAPGVITWAEVRSFLDTRGGLLEAVVFSGGEPTLQPALPAAMREARNRGFAVGLHSAGCSPRGLAAALGEADWLGLDVKADPTGYSALTRRARSGRQAEAALRVALAAQAARETSARPLDLEVRTTVYPALIDAKRLAALGRRLAAAGVHRWALQAFRTEGSRLPPARDAEQAAHAMIREVASTLSGRFDQLTTR